MKKRIAIFAAAFCLLCAGVGSFAANAENINYTISNKYINSYQTSTSKLTSRINYSTFLARNSSYYHNAKMVQSESYNVTASSVTLIDSGHTIGNTIQIDCLIDVTCANNFLGVGTMGYTTQLNVGTLEDLVVLSRKTSATRFLPRSYYEDFLI